MASATCPRFSGTICAIQVLAAEDGTDRMGLITQVYPDPSIQICGPGFNPSTVKVSVNGSFYFVFMEDLERGKKSKV